MKEMFRISLCLTVVCLLAGTILGGVYFFTEPAKQIIRAKREAKLVRHLLDLEETAKIVELRRYLKDGDNPRIGYLFPDLLQIYDMEGKFVEEIARKNPDTSPETSDAWVRDVFPGSHFVGRFFIAWNANNELQGYVTEGSSYGFKSHIRFFLALTADLQIRGVEVVSHEEDPGLGAEITKPLFKHQFDGRTFDSIENLTVSKDPMPATRRTDILTGKRIPFEGPIYAVTGATISSRALTDGVKKSVLHLHHRLQVLRRAYSKTDVIPAQAGIQSLNYNEFPPARE